jgi:hypothetical protein
MERERELWVCHWCSIIEQEEIVFLLKFETYKDLKIHQYKHHKKQI